MKSLLLKLSLSNLTANKAESSFTIILLAISYGILYTLFLKLDSNLISDISTPYTLILFFVILFSIILNYRLWHFTLKRAERELSVYKTFGATKKDIAYIFLVSGLIEGIIVFLLSILIGSILTILVTFSTYTTLSLSALDVLSYIKILEISLGTITIGLSINLYKTLKRYDAL